MENNVNREAAKKDSDATGTGETDCVHFYMGSEVVPYLKILSQVQRIEVLYFIYINSY